MAADSGLLLVIAGIAAIMDVHRTRVENSWILFALCTGLLWRIFQEGPKGILGFAAGIAFPLAALGVLFYFRMLGPGDIKLFCALGGIMGVSDIGVCMLVSFLLGAVFSLAILISSGNFCRRFQYLICYFREYFHTGKVKPYYQKGMALENFHFTVPVFLSVVLYAGGVY